MIKKTKQKHLSVAIKMIGLSVSVRIFTFSVPFLSFIFNTIQFYTLNRALTLL